MAVGFTYSATDDLPIDLDKYRGGFILKVDKNGKIQNADKFVGLNHNENNSNILYDIFEAQDGIYYAIGEQSYNTITDDGMLTFESYVWVIKTDGITILAQEEFGTNLVETYPSSLVAGPDNTILTVAVSQYAAGDISSAYGMFDVWMMKLNDDLELEDDRTFGGTGSETPYILVSDNIGHYMFTAYTNSKDYDAPGSFGGSDFWAVNLNGDLDTLQTYRFGGSSYDRLTDAVFTKNGKKLYVSGYTESEDNYIHGNMGNGDIWIAAINQDETLSVENNKKENSSLSIYPNPSDGVFYLTNSNNSTYSISDITGKTIKTGDIYSDNQKIDIKNFGKGVYFIEVISETHNNSKQVQKIIIN